MVTVKLQDDEMPEIVKMLGLKLESSLKHPFKRHLLENNSISNFFLIHMN